MLDLQPRVHFHEIEPPVFSHEELDRADAGIGYGRGDSNRRLPERIAKCCIHQRRRRFLDHLLVATLARAVALAEMDDVAMGIGSDLNLYMTDVVERPLEDHGRGAEGAQPFATRARQCLGELRQTLDAPHPTSPAAGHRLDQQRSADPFSFGDQSSVGLIEVVVPGYATDVGLLDVCRHLSAISRTAARLGPMKHRPALAHASAKSAFSDRKPYPGCTAWAPAARRPRSAARRRDTVLRDPPHPRDETRDRRQGREVSRDRRRYTLNRAQSARRRRPRNTYRDLPSICDEDSVEFHAAASHKLPALRNRSAISRDTPTGIHRSCWA